MCMLLDMGSINKTRTDFYFRPDIKTLNVLQVMFNAVLENACSEQGARMSAMDSSSRNAGEMLDRLTLTYNRFHAYLIALL